MMSEYLDITMTRDDDITIMPGCMDLVATFHTEEVTIDARYVRGPLRVENGYLEESEPGVWMIREGERPDR